MRKLSGMLLVLALGAGAWFASQKWDIRGLDQIKLEPRSGEQSPQTAENPAPARQDGESLKIASFNIQVFGESKQQKRHVMQVLSEVARQFDIVAIQEIRAMNQTVLPRFVDEINAAGRHYDYALGPRLGRTSSKEQYAYVYDTATVEIDRSSIYTVHDPDDLLHREPLVASFRVRGPPPDQAFTFTLINIHTDPDDTYVELNALDDVFRAVREDGSNEDDVILLGDLNVDDRHLGQLGEIPGITWAISGVPTNTRGTELYDNIVFDRRATAEFTGSSGVMNLMQAFNLTMDQALEVSDHQPIWAAFDLYEGGQPGRLATRPAPAAR